MPYEREDIRAVASLDEPVRRALYEWVVAARRPVSRDEAAAGVGATRALAAFHLDRLVREGLLDTEFRRLTGRTGPGAGRPSKLYRRAPRELSISLPERRYDVAARLFAEAMDSLPGDDGRPEGSAPPPLADAARRLGREVGTEARRRAGARPGRPARRAALLAVLAERGYEPLDAGDEVRLGNCPFHALIEDHRQLVCGMNLALAEGLVGGLEPGDLSARLDPRPGQCCVAFTPPAGAAG